MKVIIPLLLALISMQANAQQASYSEARAFFSRISSPVDVSHSWNKLPLAERLKVLHEVEVLTENADRMFGKKGAACLAAAMGSKLYMMEMNELALVMDGRKQASPEELFSSMADSVRFGQSLLMCEAYIESMNAK